MRLLIIDDEPSVLRCLERTLRGHYDVTTVASATAALILVAKRHFDAILCDVNMPDMTGHELIEKLTPERASRVVLMSGGFNESLTHKILAKPLVHRELLDTLDGLATGL
jgi:CheY-like chemotaxis protein